MKKKENSNKLNLSKETVSVLGSESLKNVKGGARTIDEDVMLDIDTKTIDWDVDDIDVGQIAPGLY
tara:strand:+ start:506 stop:703 length:198 start_codon:yes stop_codon:yes gene_type:complete